MSTRERKTRAVGDFARILVADFCRRACRLCWPTSRERLWCVAGLHRIQAGQLQTNQELWKTSRSEVAIFAITVIVIVCEDLLVGVARRNFAVGSQVAVPVLSSGIGIGK